MSVYINIYIALNLENMELSINGTTLKMRGPTLIPPGNSMRTYTSRRTGNRAPKNSVSEKKCVLATAKLSFPKAKFSKIFHC